MSQQSYRARATAVFQEIVGAPGLRTIAADMYTVLSRSAKPQRLPRHLQIEIITRCNLSCIMCPRTVALARTDSAKGRTEWFQAMPKDRYERILDQVPTVQSISLHGIGEPLMHPNIFELVEQAASRGINVRFTSNLTLLTPARAERLVHSGLHRLIVSLDGCTAQTYEAIRINASFAQVIANLNCLIHTRRTVGAGRPQIDVNMVVGESNHHEALDMVRFCHALGVDGLILSPVKPANAGMIKLVCSEVVWRQIVTDAMQEASRLGLRLHVRGDPARSNGKLSTQGNKDNKETWRCLQPWTTSTIMIDGSVMPCCNIHDRQHAMDNILAEDFGTIWTGVRYQSFRETLKQPGRVPAPCTWCPDF